MNKTILLAALLITNSALAIKPLSICGERDDRVLSYDTKIGRLSAGNKHIGCTVTMISDKCGVTAGHCEKALEYAEFDVPMSKRNGKPNPSDPANKYYIESYESQSGELALGNDWAVVKFKKNEITDQYPGNVQGYYKIGLRVPAIGEKIIITGHGVDTDDKDRNGVQQTHFGYIRYTDRTMAAMVYDVDTMGGNSGSTILNENNEIIGIHTNGGCDRELKGNIGLMLRFKKDLRVAIKKCLAR